jgi:hypothetical protein
MRRTRVCDDRGLFQTKGAGRGARAYLRSAPLTPSGEQLNG